MDEEPARDEPHVMHDENVPEEKRARDRALKRLLVIGTIVVLALAGFVSYYASSKPDGLEKVSADHHLDARKRDQPMKDSPVGGYQVKGVHDARLSNGLAGLAGVGVVAAAGGGLFWLARRRRTERRDGP
ncbi:PDGLE domain-containing protein [Actinomadura gamaensis]|uniref:PDGLE domain-containing protein n=1 Tax=Actinomadura gamaensis TaxID=1763541 RepID=A0ABV9TTT3_9ACTN